MTDMLTRRQLSGALVVFLAGYTCQAPRLRAEDGRQHKQRGYNTGHQPGRVPATGPARGNAGRSNVQNVRIIAVGGYRMPTNQYGAYPAASSGSGSGRRPGYTRHDRDDSHARMHNPGSHGNPGRPGGKPGHGCRGLGSGAHCTEPNPGRGHGATGTTGGAHGGTGTGQGGTGGGQAQDGGKHGDTKKSARK